MKCPFCNSEGLIGVTIGAYYVPEGKTIDSNKLPKELKFYCNNCKRKCDPTDIVLKVLYNHKGEINQATQLECVDGIIIANESSLPIPEIREALSTLKRRGQVIITQGEVDKPDLGAVYAKITDTGKNIVAQFTTE